MPSWNPAVPRPSAWVSVTGGSVQECAVQCSVNGTCAGHHGSCPVEHVLSCYMAGSENKLEGFISFISFSSTLLSSLVEGPSLIPYRPVNKFHERTKQILSTSLPTEDENHLKESIKYTVYSFWWLFLLVVHTVNQSEVCKQDQEWGHHLTTWLTSYLK